MHQGYCTLLRCSPAHLNHMPRCPACEAESAKTSVVKQIALRRASRLLASRVHEYRLLTKWLSCSVPTLNVRSGPQTHLHVARSTGSAPLRSTPPSSVSRCPACSRAPELAGKKLHIRLPVAVHLRARLLEPPACCGTTGSKHGRLHSRHAAAHFHFTGLWTRHRESSRALTLLHDSPRPSHC